MVFGLIGLAFNAVTFPGLLVNGAIQSRFDEKYRVPSARVAVEEGVALGGLSADDEELYEVARVLGDGERPAASETVEWVVNYAGIERYPDLFKVVTYPFAVTTLVGALLLGVTGALVASGVASFDGYAWLLPFWLGFSVAAHAFPNQDPTNALWALSGETDSLLRIAAYPLVGVSKLINALEFLWLDAIYALAVWGAVGYAFGIY